MLKKISPFVAFIFLAIATVLSAVGLLRSQNDPYSQSQIDFSSLTGEFDTSSPRGEFYGKTVTSLHLQDKTTAPTQVLGETIEDKHIEVDLTTQRLYAYEGETKVYDFLISSGKWGKTPTGTFRIWSKFKYTKMSGGSKEKHTYYYLPNVPFTMFFSNDEVPAARGFGIHGTYWHENFGHPMSHGCINMRTEEAELIYNWAGPVTGDKTSIRATDDNPGTLVIIYGVAPNE